MTFPHLTTVTPFEDNVTDVLAEDQIHHAVFGNLQVTALPTAITGTATAGSTGQTLVASGATFVSSGVAVGDVVYNATDASYAIVKSVDSKTQLTTTPLKWGTSNVWASTNSFTIKAAPFMAILLLQTDGSNAPGIYIRKSDNSAWELKTGSGGGWGTADLDGMQPNALVGLNYIFPATYTNDGEWWPTVVTETGIGTNARKRITNFTYDSYHNVTQQEIRIRASDDSFLYGIRKTFTYSGDSVSSVTITELLS